MRNEVSRKRIYAWNAAGSIVYALSSLVMLLVVTQFCGEEEGGIYSIGYAIAQLMLTIGVFEATVFFATDVKNSFSHEQYLAFKIITCFAMIIVSIIYTASFGFDTHKKIVAYALCAFRLIEAFSQFWYAAYQRHERLDIGGFSTVFRMILAVVSFTVVIAVRNDVILACITATVVEILWIVFYDMPRLNAIQKIGFPDFSITPLRKLFLACLPLFLSSFCAAYINNIAKYAIESVGSNTMQTVFNILFMPAFIINMFTIFIMRPSLTTLANYWSNQNTEAFWAVIVRLLLSVLGITISVLAICSVIGVPLLQWLFGINLNGMTSPLLVVMLGGGFFAASNVVYNLLVIVRSQHLVPIGYLLPIIIVSSISEPMVRALNILGACLCHCVAGAMLCISFVIIFHISYRMQNKT